MKFVCTDLVRLDTVLHRSPWPGATIPIMLCGLIIPVTHSGAGLDKRRFFKKKNLFSFINKRRFSIIKEDFRHSKNDVTMWRRNIIRYIFLGYLGLMLYYWLLQQLVRVMYTFVTRVCVFVIKIFQTFYYIEIKINKRK